MSTSTCCCCWILLLHIWFEWNRLLRYFMICYAIISYRYIYTVRVCVAVVAAAFLFLNINNNNRNNTLSIILVCCLYVFFFVPSRGSCPLFFLSLLCWSLEKEETKGCHLCKDYVSGILFLFKSACNRASNKLSMIFIYEANSS